MRTSAIALLVLCLGTTACKKNEDETAKPEEETWVPDETNEPVAAPTPTAPELSEEEKLEQAKVHYKDAEAKAEAGDWPAALELYEKAYYLVPAKHGFALKVALAAEQVGDCTKAISYYEHFVKYADPEKYADDLKKAQKSLDGLKKKGC
jgi:tetratricopeptide (TPR) repeat protein